MASSWGKTPEAPPYRDVLRKKCSENMQQVYRRTSMPKCDFNRKISIQSHFGMGVLL